MSDSIRVFVNAVGLDLPAGATALDAVRAWNADEGAAVAAGARVIADSRGLPVAPGAPVYQGAIFRVVANRERRAGAPLADGAVER